jgi:CheY-like chemotaxis protein
MPKADILIIDPSSNLLNAFRMILEEEHYQVGTAKDLKEAHGLLTENHYGVVLTECYPPFEDTVHLIRWAKEKSPETYWLAGTALNLEEGDYEELFSAGLDELITKPFTPRQLLVYIRKGLAQENLIREKKEVEKKSPLDPLAQREGQYVYKTPYFKRCIFQEMKKAQRHEDPMSLLLLKIPPREKAGEAYENFYLELIKLLRKNLREGDILGKENGNLGILLYKTDPQGSEVLEQRLRMIIQTHPAFKSSLSSKSLIEELNFQHFSFPANSDYFETFLNGN